MRTPCHVRRHVDAMPLKEKKKHHWSKELDNLNERHPTMPI
jgi:hypothetical protein